MTTSVGVINDNGVIIGDYIVGNLENPSKGFILQNGIYKKLSFVPSDINNSGTMVAGNSIVYSDGTTKLVNAPGAFQTSVYGINDRGVVTGDANYSAGGGAYTWKNFTAVCK